MITKLENLLPALRSLTVFREVLKDPVIESLCWFLSEDSDGADAVDNWCDFVSQLYSRGYSDLSKYISDILRCCDNPVVRIIGEGGKVSEVMAASTENELKILEDLASLTPKKLHEGIHYEGKLPEWEVSKVSLTSEFSEQTKNIAKHGYGIYAKYRAFYLDGKKITHIECPDGIRLSELVGYQREKKLIIDNTKALLDGKPAANILLTGDAGTGKSSTVKAVVNELCGEGLRILELKKEQLHSLPEILHELNRNPLKFIIFIDDLSFTGNDDNFSALKAILEGSVSAKAQNVVIYATSNRKHLIKEKFSERDGDDVHRNDTMQETVSLSERFGLQITFSRPDKATYLEIVKHLCEEHGIAYSSEKLETAAEKFALSRASRSARAAKQFVDMLRSGAEEDIN